MSGTCMLLDVSNPVSPDGWQSLAIFYGYTPIGYLLLCLIAFAWTKGGTREFGYMAVAGVSACIVEILKSAIKQARPAASLCSASYGMPSGHSTLSCAWIALIALDSTVSKSKSLTNPLVLVTMSLFLLAPVPVSRVILGDHSAPQAMAGSLLGLAVGSLWFAISIPVRKALAPYQGTRLLWLFNHNYAPLMPAKSADEDETLPV
jgi:membrane-associated phospholipid phosphatase